MEPVSRAEIEGWNSAAGQLVALVSTLPEQSLDQIAAGEWSARTILSHMLDAEIAFSNRMRIALAVPGGAIAPFDQDATAASVPYDALTVEAIGSALLGLRAVNTAIMLALPASAWESTVTHPEYGIQDLPKIVRIFGNHFTEHLNDLEQFASPAG